MDRHDSNKIARAVLDAYGRRTFAEELGIGLHPPTPQSLFELLCFSLLSGVRFHAEIAVLAVGALKRNNWTTPQDLLGSTREGRASEFQRAGMHRFSLEAAEMLEDSARMLLDNYGGDLNVLRERAGRDREKERALLSELRGMGDYSVSTFFREAQAAWEELFPFIDELQLKVAAELGLPPDAEALRRLVGDEDLPRLGAALVRVRLEHGFDIVRQRLSA